MYKCILYTCIFYLLEILEIYFFDKGTLLLFSHTKKFIKKKGTKILDNEEYLDLRMKERSQNPF